MLLVPISAARNGVASRRAEQGRRSIGCLRGAGEDRASVSQVPARGSSHLARTNSQKARHTRAGAHACGPVFWLRTVGLRLSGRSHGERPGTVPQGGLPIPRRRNSGRPGPHLSITAARPRRNLTAFPALRGGSQRASQPPGGCMEDNRRTPECKRAKGMSGAPGGRDTFCGRPSEIAPAHNVARASSRVLARASHQRDRRRTEKPARDARHGQDARATYARAILAPSDAETVTHPGARCPSYPHAVGRRCAAVSRRIVASCTPALILNDSFPYPDSPRRGRASGRRLVRRGDRWLSANRKPASWPCR